MFRLALAETETYANNATGVWTAIFQLYLSGTPVSYPDRLQLLESRFQGEDERERRLCFAGLDTSISAFRGGSGRVLGPPVVAGRIPPAEWQPTSSAEATWCWEATVSLLRRLTHHGDASTREAALRLAVKRVHTILLLGSLRDAREMIAEAGALPDDLLASLLKEIDEFLEFFSDPQSKLIPMAVEAGVRAWRDQLVPDTLHGRLVATIGQEPWHLWGRGRGQGRGQADQEPVIREIAEELLRDRAAFDREIGWLLSEHAKSAFRLGDHLGELDVAGELLEPLLAAAVASAHLGLARGYLKGLTERHPPHLGRANELLDSYQQDHPQAIFDLSSAATALRPFPRLLAMVDGGQLAPVDLRGYFYAGKRHLPSGELAEVLSRLTGAARRGDVDAARAALNVLWIQLGPKAGGSATAALQDPEIRGLLTDILRLSAETASREVHAWDELLGYLAEIDPDEAAAIAGLGLTSQDLRVRESAVACLTALAHAQPKAVMERLGAALLDPTVGPILGIQGLHGLVGALPPGVVRCWLESHGLPGRW